MCALGKVFRPPSDGFTNRKWSFPVIVSSRSLQKGEWVL